MDLEIQHIAMLKKDLSDQESIQFDTQFSSMRKNPTVALILSIFLGGLGIDRFYLGYVGLGIGKLLTLGGLGLWAFIDWFLIMKAAREKNIEIAQELKTAISQNR